MSAPEQKFAEQFSGDVARGLKFSVVRPLSEVWAKIQVANTMSAVMNSLPVHWV